jgi:carbonic anhydrase
MTDELVHRRRFLALLGAGAGAAAAGTSGVLSGASAWADSGGSKSGPHFSYEGPTRAARWGSLSPDYRACSAGNSQTPINVISGNVEPSASSAQLHYQGVAATALNNGHTLMINAKSGASIVVDGASYDLKQFHYHTPSEHTYDGRPFMVEWHFVHQDSAGNTAAVAVMANVGAAHPGYAAILAAAPTGEGKTKSLPAPVDPAGLLPADRSAVGYDGSLTTPPCTEALHWTLFVQPVEMSLDQVQMLQNYLGPNARTLQAINGRTLHTRTVT